MALTTFAPPRSATAPGGRPQIARLLALALTAVAAVTFLCGSATAFSQSAAMGGGPHARPAAVAGVTAEQAAAEVRMADAVPCEKCLREDGLSRCVNSGHQGLQGATPDTASAAAPGRVAAAIPAVGTPSVLTPGGGDPGARPPDLHLLQLWRV
ncbi:hypothetical protein [Streptomyces sp. NPDC044948]|uniref:hypothetical protein n=1 Tax=Streptomyces sp. NPDC044948 TaxID=3157092 RepID=UPI0033F54ECD